MAASQYQGNLAEVQMYDTCTRFRCSCNQTLQSQLALKTHGLTHTATAVILHQKIKWRFQATPPLVRFKQHHPWWDSGRRTGSRPPGAWRRWWGQCQGSASVWLADKGLRLPCHLHRYPPLHKLATCRNSFEVSCVRKCLQKLMCNTVASQLLNPNYCPFKGTNLLCMPH